MQYDIVLNVFNTIPFSTREFPKGDHRLLYRITWFGKFNLNPQAPSEPIVEMVLTPYWEAEINPATINTKRAYNYGASQTIQVGVGQLASLPIGGFIRDSHVVGLPDYRIETYNLMLDDAHTSIIRADATYDDRNSKLHYIPSDYYPLPAHVRTTRCLVVEHPVSDKKDVSRVIFPCAELLRAYFATSSGLIKEIIKGGMAVGANRIFDPDQTGFGEDGTGYVGLRRGMRDVDAATIARFALDPQIREEVQGIHNSLLVNDNHGEGYVPIVRPPFKGKTKMVLHGKRLLSGERWHFLVFRIEDCTGSYPFERLRYSRDNDGRSNDRKDLNRPEAYKTETNSVRHSSLKSDDAEISSDDEPSIDRAETEVKLTGRQFSSLPLDIDKVKKCQCHSRAADHLKAAIKKETKRLSTADGDHGETELDRLTISCKLQGEQEDSSDRLPAFLVMLKVLCHKDSPHLSYKVINVPPPTPGSKASNFSFFPDKLRSKPLAWSFIPGTPRTRRRAIIAEVQYQRHHFYLFEAEKRPPKGETEESIASLIVHNADGAPLDHEMLAQILLQGAVNGGVWLREWRWAELRREKLIHQSVTVERFAERFLQYFRKQISITESAPLMLSATTDLSNVA